MGKSNLEEIKIFKEKIINAILNGAVEEEYDIPEESKIILDEFFDKTSDEVITKSLIKIYERLTYPGDTTRWRKNKFKVRVLAVRFPDNYHSKIVLSYLEEKYRSKIEELNLGEIGIIDYDIVHDTYGKEDEFYNISYSTNDCLVNKFYKYKSNSYMLELTFSLTNKKDKAKEKMKTLVKNKK